MYTVWAAKRISLGQVRFCDCTSRTINHLATSEKTNNHQESLYHIWKNKQSSEIALPHVKKKTIIRNHFTTSEKKKQSSGITLPHLKKQTTIRNHLTTSEKNNHLTTSEKKTIRNHLTTSEKTNNHQKLPCHIWKNKQSSGITLPHLKKQTSEIILQHLKKQTIIRNYLTTSEKTNNHQESLYHI